MRSLSFKLSRLKKWTKNPTRLLLLTMISKAMQTKLNKQKLVQWFLSLIWLKFNSR